MVRSSSFAFCFVAACVTAAPAFAEFAKVTDETEFVSIVSGKELKRPFVRLEVSPQGEISGQGAAWPVEGSWTWRDGYFCRELF